MKNMCYLRVPILIALIAINMAPSMANDDGNHNSSIKIYNRTVAKFPWRKYPCKEPQSRAYILPDLMQSAYPSAGESVNIPFYIVLKRCDVHSGCCATSSKTCAPVESEIYYEKVEIEIDSLQTNSTRKEWIQIEQHAKCDCTETSPQQWHELERRHPKIKRLSSKEELPSS